MMCLGGGGVLSDVDVVVDGVLVYVSMELCV